MLESIATGKLTRQLCHLLVFMRDLLLRKHGTHVPPDDFTNAPPG